MAANGTPEQPNDTPRGGQPSGGGFSISGKTLGIAGGGAVALVVVIVVVVLLLTGVFGGGGASGGGDVLAYVPGDAGFVMIVDYRAVTNGDVPEDFVEYFEDLELFSADAWGDLGIDDDDVATWALVDDENSGSSLVIVRGDFEFDDTREELEDGADCEDDDYRGFELWECPGGGAVALFERDRYLVFGEQDDLEQLLTYKRRTPEKLADAGDSEIKEILDRAGSGWLRFAGIGDDCPIERCDGIAIAVGESADSDAIPASYAVLFSSERAAAASEGDVAIDDFLEEMFADFDLELDIGEVKAEGEFVVGSGTAEFVDPDEPRSRSTDPSGGVGVNRENESARAPALPTQGIPAALAETTVPFSEWVNDCEQATVHPPNAVESVRPDQRERFEAETAQYCRCLHDYFLAYWGMEPRMMSAKPEPVILGRGSGALVDAYTYQRDMLDPASSYCAEHNYGNY